MSGLLLLFCGANISLPAQTKHTINGYFKDAKSGEQLPGASLRVKDNPSLGATANEYGFFSLTLNPGNYTLVATSLGYTQKQITISTATKDQKLDILLEPAGSSLTEVVVSSRSARSKVSSAQMGVENLTMKEVNKLPVLFGERDVLKNNSVAARGEICR